MFLTKISGHLTDAVNGLLRGVASLMRHGRPDPNHLTLKEQACARFARRHLGAIEHERRVLLIASKLFDLTVNMHDLSSRDRRVLRMAAVLHDVGRKFGEKNHPADGSRMIADVGYLPVSAKQRRALMYLTRYHRGAVPRGGYDGVLERGDGRKSIRIVLALLRAADALDNRQLDPPAISITLKANRLSITCFVESDLSKARRAFKRRKKFRLLEELLDCQVQVEVRRAEVVEHV